VSSIGLEIAKGTERPGLPWAFYVIDDASVNAFALPGGPVFVTRGILGAMNSEGELASVLGHEIGHITARHSVQQMSQQQLATLGLGLGSILSSKVAEFSGALGQGLQLLFLKYSRDDESQADALGFRYMVQSNYDPRQMAAMFKILDRQAPAEGRLPDWLSSHPDPGNRYETATQRVDSLHRDLSSMVVNKDTFLAHINGLVHGENPREGYFKDGTFYHPELKFQFRIPSGWKVQNTKQAVLAVSGQQDAMVQLSMGQGAPLRRVAAVFRAARRPGRAGELGRHQRDACCQRIFPGADPGWHVGRTGLVHQLRRQQLPAASLHRRCTAECLRCDVPPGDEQFRVTH